ncbi:hypothetical protein NQ315_017526 [Exocentrus adspersus]|uniref:RNA-directed DNA polymerase n=1 Tax=Exocentrus adspersus TaxID=1586481 RepID=A0AAV8VJT1_9CUCU|nr:hypothetical protein NQ315_017526 [Exocentrus adspersus]
MKPAENLVILKIWGEVLPEFDPVKGDISINQWIEKIEEYGEVYDWDDVAIKHYALSKLCGVAKSWRDSLPARSSRTWLEWCELLREDFPCEKSELSLRLDAQKYKRRMNQDIVEYFYEKLSRCNKAKMSDAETIEWIVDGLDNVKFRDYLGPLRRYNKPCELLLDIKSANSYVGHQKERSVGRFHSGTTVKKTSVKCFKCNQEGHIANRCTNKVDDKSKNITCFKCNGKGHYARDCSKVSNNQNVVTSSTSAAGNSSVLHIGSNTHSKYFKDAVINGSPTKCYVDLGSSCVAIRSDIVKEMGLTYFETDLDPLIGYGQGIVKPIGMLTVDLEIDGVVAKVDAHVVPEQSQLVPVIVGHPFTEQPHVRIISTCDKLQVSTGDTDLPTVENRSAKCKISTGESLVIPSNFLGHVTVCSTVRNETLCVEGGIRETGHFVPRCIIETNEEGKSVLPVLNLTSETLKLNQGDLITRGEVCEMVDMKTQEKKEVNDEPVTYEEINTDLSEDESQIVLDLLNENKQLVARKLSVPVMGITITTDWVAALQRADDEILAVKAKLEEGDTDTRKKFTLYKGRVYRTSKGWWRLYVPQDIRHELVIEAHNSLMHLGIDKTVAKLKESYYFPKMRDFVSKYVNRCLNCLYYKVPGGKRPGFLHPLDKGSEPFQCVHIDHLGPFVTSRNRNKYVIGLIDGFKDNPLTQEIKALNDSLCGEDDRENVEGLLTKNKDKLKAQYDKKRKEAPKYQPHDLVLVRSEAPSTGDSRKLVPKYKGPYEVVKVLDNDRYLIQDIEGEQQSARFYKGIVAVDRLKLVPKDQMPE